MTSSAWLKSLSKHIFELRIHSCPSSVGSDGVRSFLSKHYLNMAKENPSLPILIRESHGVPARVIARYAAGKEKKIPLEGLTVDQIESKFQSL